MAQYLIKKPAVKLHLLVKAAIFVIEFCMLVAMQQVLRFRAHFLLQFQMIQGLK